MRHLPFKTVRRSKIGPELARVRGAIKSLGKQLDPTYWPYLPLRLKSARQAGHPNARVAAEVHSCLSKLQRMNENGLLDAAIEFWVSEAIKLVEGLPEESRVKWNAVLAIEALRDLWWRNTGNEAPPKSLNPASPFAIYLFDGFEYLNISADPISGFKRWATLHRRSMLASQDVRQSMRIRRAEIAQAIAEIQEEKSRSAAEVERLLALCESQRSRNKTSQRSGRVRGHPSGSRGCS